MATKGDGPSPEYLEQLQPYLEANETQMAWILEWFREDLPLENKAGDSLVQYTQEVLDSIYCASEPTMEHVQEAVPLHAPQFPPMPPPKKMKVLVFADKGGYCEAIMENAPEGRIGTKKVVNWRDYSLEDEDGNENLEIVGELIGPKGWDLIIWGGSMDTPKSNDVPDIIAFQTKMVKVLLAVVKFLVTTENPTPKMCVLTRGAWSDDPELHKTVGLSLVTNSLMYGFCNTARQELEGSGTLLHYIDTEYFMKPPFWDTTDYQLLPRLASEIFCEITFGANTVRMLNSGRYVARLVNAKPYAEAGHDFPMPGPGDIVGIGGGNGALGLLKATWLLDKAIKQGNKGFKIQFLSRSMKITDVNMPLWKEVQKKAEQLDVEAVQMKLDLASQEAADQYVESCNGKLFGFIHSAGVLADTLIMNITWANFETVWNPKHRAALWLHSAFERIPHKLRFFWNFSSSSVYGNMGQLNYSASNSYLDGMCRHRIALGLPAQTFQWGAWGEVGMASLLDDASKRRFNAGPYPMFSNKEGLSGLDEGLLCGLPTVMVVKINPPAMLGYISGPRARAADMNIYSEHYPLPALPAELQHAYNILRIAGFPYVGNPNRDPLIFNQFTAPYVAKDDAGEYEEQVLGMRTDMLKA